MVDTLVCSAYFCQIVPQTIEALSVPTSVLLNVETPWACFLWDRFEHAALLHAVMHDALAIDLFKAVIRVLERPPYNTSILIHSRSNATHSSPGIRSSSNLPLRTTQLVQPFFSIFSLELSRRAIFQYHFCTVFSKKRRKYGCDSQTHAICQTSLSKRGNHLGMP